MIDYKSERLCSCGARGHLEAYASGPAMSRRYAELAGDQHQTDLRQIGTRARTGESSARQAIEEGATALGLALGGLLNVFDPQILIIGGGVPDLGEVWLHPFEAALRVNPLPGAQKTSLRRAALGTSATLVGAGYLALQSL